MAEAAAERVQTGVEMDRRGPWKVAWSRLRSDRVAFVSGIVFLAILVLCFAGGPFFSWLLGHGPDDQFPNAVSPELKPVGPWTWVPDSFSYVEPGQETDRTLFVMGADSSLGRDLFLRVLYGGQVSLMVGLGAAFLSILIGVPLGIVAGYAGGSTDWAISRTTELFMGFPLLLFLVAIGYTLAPRFNDVTLGGAVQPGVLVLVVVIGAFSWFVPARIVRAAVLAVREQEFIEAARMVGASDARIMRTHILPYVAAPLIVWSTLIVAGFIVFEAAIAFLNVGIKLPTASWGSLMASNWGTLLVFNPLAPGQLPGYYVDKSNWVLFFPTAALFITIVSLALFGEGLRRAIDPRGTD